MMRKDKVERNHSKVATASLGQIIANVNNGIMIASWLAGAQSGPYVGLTIIGMIGGSLITAVAMYFFYKKRVGVT